MALTTTHTRTYTVVAFADPHKSCDECGAWITGYRVYPGEDVGPTHPCGHDASYTDWCPSWGPVDGCTCLTGSHPVPVMAL